MTIQDPVQFCAGLWDWAILDGCFGDTKIKPTDCEGLVERHGWFLFIETKSPGAEIPTGQWIMFESLAKTGKFTVLIVWGKTNKPEEIQIITRHKIHDKELCNLDKFRHVVKTWFAFTDNDVF